MIENERVRAAAKWHSAYVKQCTGRWIEYYWNHRLLISASHSSRFCSTHAEHWQNRKWQKMHLINEKYIKPFSPSTISNFFTQKAQHYKSLNGARDLTVWFLSVSILPCSEIFVPNFNLTAISHQKQLQYNTTSKQCRDLNRHNWNNFRISTLSAQLHLFNTRFIWLRKYMVG